MGNISGESLFNALNSVSNDLINESIDCICPEMPYCPSCEYGHVLYPDDVETYEDTQGCSTEWICTYKGKGYKHGD